MCKATELGQQIKSDAVLKSAKLLQQLFIVRPKSLERFSAEQVAGINWALQNINTSGVIDPSTKSSSISADVDPSQEAITLSSNTDVKVPAGWLNNYSKAIEFAESVTKAVPKLQEIKRQSESPPAENTVPNMMSPESSKANMDQPSLSRNQSL